MIPRPPGDRHGAEQAERESNRLQLAEQLGREAVTLLLTPACDRHREQLDAAAVGLSRLAAGFAIAVLQSQEEQT